MTSGATGPVERSSSNAADCFGVLHGGNGTALLAKIFLFSFHFDTNFVQIGQIPFA